MLEIQPAVIFLLKIVGYLSVFEKGSCAQIIRPTTVPQIAPKDKGARLTRGARRLEWQGEVLWLALVGFEDPGVCRLPADRTNLPGMGAARAAKRVVERYIAVLINVCKHNKVAVVSKVALVHE